MPHEKHDSATSHYPLNYCVSSGRNFQSGLSSATRRLGERLRRHLLWRFEAVECLQIIPGQHHRISNARRPIPLEVDFDVVSTAEVAIQNEQCSGSALLIK